MKRRDFLRSTGTLCAGLALSKSIPLFADQSAPWRSFEVTTRVEVLQPSGPTRIWLPAALVENTPFQRTHSNTFHAEGGKAKLIQDKLDALGVISAIYPEHARPILTLTSRASLRDYAVDLSRPGREHYVPAVELEYFRRPTKFVPTDGIVKDTAMKATKGATTDLEKARAIYEWIVDNTFRDPKVLGCGRGDIRFMLESGDLGGKCADLNALYVGLARSVGLPARHVYGLRIAKSEFGYKSLGTASATVTKSQHCRAEVYLEKHGWVPVDPADVRKVVLEEPPGYLTLSDAPVTRARTRLFGSWEMNWMAYNYGQDISLPGSTRDPLVFFMYPQAETAEGRIDSLDPDHFRYEITVEELS